MPKQRIHLKNFEGFTGLDEKSSDLTRSRNAAKVIDNFELNRVFSLGGRKGFKKAAAKTQKWFLGLHNYVYQDENGATQEELLAIDNNLWRLLETGTFTIAYAGAGTTYGYKLLPHSSGDYFEFVLYVDGAVVATVNLKGAADAYPYTITDLAALETAIEAVAGFTVTIAGGASTLDAAILPLSTQTTTAKVNSTVISFAYWEMVQCAGAVSNPFQDFYDARASADFKNATFQNARNVCYIATGYQRLMKYDGQAVYSAGLRKMGDRTANFAVGSGTAPADILVSAGSATGLTGTVQVFATFAYEDARGNFIRSRPSAVTSITLANTKLSASVRSYSCGQIFAAKTSGTISTNTITTQYMSNDHVRRMGYPEVIAGDYVAGSYSGGQAFGTTVVSFYDSLIRRLVSVNFDAKSFVVDGSTPAGAGAVSYFYTTDPFANMRVFIASSTQTNVAAGTNISGSVYCKVGDKLFFPTSKITATVTAVGGTTTIKVDKQVSVTNAEIISVIRVEFWRTKLGATQTFYKYAEIGTFPWISAIDSASNNNVGDDDLGEVYVELDKNADDPYWKPSIVTEHQGQLILSGDKDFPNRVFHEDILTPEGFQHSTNFLDVPSSESGVITACWSDDFNQLAVFKEHSYFNVTGDLTTVAPSYSITKVTENDYGVSSQNSLTKFRGINIGIGELGFIAFKNGEIDYTLGSKLSPIFLNKTAANNALSQSEILRVKRSIIINDSQNERIICFIPAELYNVSLTRVPYIYSKIYVYDYSDNTWFGWSFPVAPNTRYGSYLPAAGMALHDGAIYFADKDYDPLGTYTNTSTLYKFHSNSTDDIKYDYADNTKAITYDLWMQWESLDDPGIEKIFDRLKMYCFDPYTFVPFIARVRTYINYNETTTIDDFEWSFSTETIKELDKKLKATKGRVLSVRITTSALHSKPTITGIEMTSALTYSPEKLQ